MTTRTSTVHEHTFRSMASDVRVSIEMPSAEAAATCESIEALFAAVEKQCTRFDPASDLMRANAAGEQWCAVGQYCYDALYEAHRAYRWSGQLFDPRVMATLRAYGYTRSLPFGADMPAMAPGAQADGETSARTMWRPEFDPARCAVRVGPEAIDLGGIGKGLAVRWATQLLDGAGSAFLLDAGGDCYLGGAGPDGLGWSVGVEDPRGGTEPVAVLVASDIGCATSSIRLRQWKVSDGTGERVVHHLIDPRTAQSAQGGLLAVTVLDPDPARAEVWTKVLFLHGRDGVADAAERGDVCALWVEESGVVRFSAAMSPHVKWLAS